MPDRGNVPLRAGAPVSYGRSAFGLALPQHVAFGTFSPVMRRRDTLPWEAMEISRTGNGPLADTGLAPGEVGNGGELPEQPPREYVDHRDYDGAVGESPEELPKGIVQRLEDLQRRLGRYEGRLELIRISETILRKHLDRERERTDRLEAELREAEAELRVAEVALFRSQRGWFSRFFGIGAAQQ
jgi:Arc/MetJ-type ribon-helix-helix transcriptional regulator